MAGLATFDAYWRWMVGFSSITSLYQKTIKGGESLMKRARFFYLLHLARIFKGLGSGKMERWLNLFWASAGFTSGWKANRERRETKW
ncbi:hypothetical protein ES703_101006 [subsurface metagenome]